MPGKAMKCIVEVNFHVITCPGTFLFDPEYVYMHMEMLGLEARTKSVPPTFPLFYHERLRFERTFFDAADPGLVATLLKGEDIILELRQHTDYITGGKVIAHCSSNTHDFLYPAISPYYGTGREILLYKTVEFKSIRVTGEPVKLEYSTKTIIKEVTDFSDGDLARKVIPTSPSKKLNTSSLKFSGVKSRSTPNLAEMEDNDEFVIRRKDDKVLSNRDFSTYVRPKPRKSVSPVRSSSLRRSASPTRSKSAFGKATVEPLPAGTYSSTLRHNRSTTEPLHNSTIRSLRYALDDLDLTEARRQHRRRYRTLTSPRVIQALNSARWLQTRADYGDLLDSDIESDVRLNVLRSSLREERAALDDAIKQADREALYRSLYNTR